MAIVVAIGMHLSFRASHIIAKDRDVSFCGIPCQTAAGVPISATATASNYTCYGTMPVPYPDTASGPDPSTIKSPTSSVAPIFWHQPQSL